MILRRITQHVRDQNWTAIAIDFVIVVVGVFIGIQLGNWNATQRDRADEASALRALHEEASAVETLSSRILADRLATLDLLSEAVDALHGGETAGLGEAHCVAIASSNDLYVGVAGLPTFAELLSSGRVGILRDEALLQALSGLAQARESLEFALSSFSGPLVNVTQAHPQLVRLVPRTIPSANAPGAMERDYSATCDLAGLTADAGALNGLVSNLEYFDAFVRDGLAPWTARLGDVHARLDALLALSHDEPAS